MTKDGKRGRSGHPHGEEEQLALAVNGLVSKYRRTIGRLRQQLDQSRSEVTRKSDRNKVLEDRLQSFRDLNEGLLSTNTALKARIEELERTQGEVSSHLRYLLVRKEALTVKMIESYDRPSKDTVQPTSPGGELLSRLSVSPTSSWDKYSAASRATFPSVQSAPFFQPPISEDMFQQMGDYRDAPR